MGTLHVRPFQRDDEPAVVQLWIDSGLTRPWNDPHKDIDRKLTQQPELFLVGEVGGEIVATVMAGYDGHRGWVNYLAVHPSRRKNDFGRTMMDRAEALLLELGCPKLNLQVRADNTDAIGFYESIGYKRDDVVSYGKRLIPDERKESGGA